MFPPRHGAWNTHHDQSVRPTCHHFCPFTQMLLLSIFINTAENLPFLKDNLFQKEPRNFGKDCLGWAGLGL